MIATTKDGIPEEVRGSKSALSLSNSENHLHDHSSENEDHHDIVVEHLDVIGELGYYIRLSCTINLVVHRPANFDGLELDQRC